MEKTFSADFASDLPSHHALAVTSLSEDDKQQLLKMINDHACLVYTKLRRPSGSGNAALGIELDVAEMRKAY